MEAITGLFFLFTIAALLVGAFRTFRRHWLLALLLMLFIPWMWIIWAMIEIFCEQPSPRIHNVSGTVNNAVATTGDKNE